LETWFRTVFWPRYPRHNGTSKSKALIEIQRVFKGLSWGAEDELGGKILAGLDRHRLLWEGKDVEFIPHAATWVHQRRWEDEDGEGER
jgi:hypothetical protein